MLFRSQCGRPRFDLWVGKIPWRRKWHPTPVLLPGKSYGRSRTSDPEPSTPPGLKRAAFPMQPNKYSVVSDSSDPMDCSPPGSSVHRIFQARVLEWIATSFSRGPDPAESRGAPSVENSERNGNTRPPDLPLGKPVCRSGSNS